MSLRLAFNCGRWHPTREQFVSALFMIQNEERKRVCDFVFQRDVKTALIGRLLIRRAIRTCLNLRNDRITLGRTDHGRPFLICDDPKIKDSNFDFNISHQDDLVVLACETSRRVGVDTMCMERPVGSPSTERFFNLMRRQLSDNEWNWLHSNGKTEGERLVNFYRIWCMKESYVKAIGIGIGYSLSRLDCCMVDDIQSATLNESSCLENPSNQMKIEGTVGQKMEPNVGHGQQGKDSTPLVLRSSFLRVDGRNMKEWLFEETVLMGKYLVCVAVENNPKLGEVEECQIRSSAPVFQFQTIEQLLEGSSKNGENDDDDDDDDDCALEELLNEWDLYLKKELQPNKNR